MLKWKINASVWFIIIIIAEQSALLVYSDLPKYMQHNYNNDCSPVLKMSASTTSIRSTGKEFQSLTVLEK